MNKEYPRKIKIIVKLLYSYRDKPYKIYPSDGEIDRLLNTHIYNPDTFEPVKFNPNYRNILKKLKKNGY